MTLLYTDSLFLDHVTGRHPEQPNRLRAIRAGLEKAALVQECRLPAFAPVSAEQVLAVHTEDVLERVRRIVQLGGGHLDGDTVVSTRSLEVALAAAGACCAAVEAVLSGEDRHALCLVRPPGHHATPDQSMGFCLFNNIALAAEQARRVHGVSRILIVDWDVHHGNGTQDIFYRDAGVYFYSIHRYGNGFYPGTGAADETGTGPGLGSNLNVCVRYGTSRPDYLRLFREGLERAAEHIKPELILLSAGFDAHALDPVGCLGLETEDFGDMTRMLLDVANTHAGGRVVSCLEGGYHLEALAASVQVHLEELLRG